MIENRQIAVLSFYSFTTIDDLQYIHPRILLAGDKCAVKGTVLIAHEGFNGS
ncbi:MAG: acylphosphatase like domain, partial [Pseudomonadota bacterium]